MPPTNNGWEKYQKLVTHELEAHTSWLKSIQNEVSAFRIEVAAQLATLRAQSRSWGAVAGIVAAGVVSFVVMLINHLLGNV